MTITTPLARLRKLDFVYTELQKAFPDTGPHNMMIAGGAVRDILTGNDPKDIDVFITGGNKRGVFARLMKDSVGQLLRTKVSQILSHFSPTHHVWSVVDSTSITRIQDKDAVVVLGEVVDIDEVDRRDRIANGHIGPDDPFDTTLDRGGVAFGYPVQIMCYTHCRTLDEIVATFDLDICMYGYNRERLITVDSSPPLDVLDKKLKGELPVEILHTHDRMRTYSRLKRFHDKYGVDTTEAKAKLRDLPLSQTEVVFEYDVEKAEIKRQKVEPAVEVSDHGLSDLWASPPDISGLFG